MHESLRNCNLPTFYWQKSFPFISTLLPLVTCIMPTANRLELMLTSIQYFLEQDYPYKELVIIDDSHTSAARFIPTLYCIRYFHLHQEYTIGTKRNKACEKAAGTIIVHIDDDDWYAPNWVSYQVDALLRSEADVCGLNKVKYHSLITDNTYCLNKDTNGKKNWLAGATLAYFKTFWQKHQFKDVQIGEDDLFIKNSHATIFAHNYYDGFIATVHSSNVRIKEV